VLSFVVRPLSAQRLYDHRAMQQRPTQQHHHLHTLHHPPPFHKYHLKAVDHHNRSNNSIADMHNILFKNDFKNKNSLLIVFNIAFYFCVTTRNIV